MKKLLIGILAALWLVALAPSPAAAAASVCAILSPSPIVVSTPIVIPAPFPTSITGPCGGTSAFVTSTTVSCPPPGGSGEYCGGLYPPLLPVIVSGTSGPGAPLDYLVVGFDLAPFDGDITAGESACYEPATGGVASVICSHSGPGMARLIVYPICEAAAAGSFVFIGILP